MNNVELARGSYEAFARGDMDAYVECFSEDTEWYVSAMLTGRDRYSGHAGVREFIDEVAKLGQEHGERFITELTDFSEVDDDRVLGLGVSRIDREQNPLEFDTGLVYTFADGKIVRLDAFTSHEEARQAAGLS